MYDAGLLTIAADDTVQLDPTIAEHYREFSGKNVSCQNREAAMLQAAGSSF